MARCRAEKKRLRSEWKKARGSSASDVASMRAQYLKIVRLHNRLRVLSRRNGTESATREERARFKKNPYKFGSNLLQDECAQRGKPSFTKEDAHQHFTNTYADEDRNVPYEPLPGLENAPLPTSKFDTGPVLRKERCRPKVQEQFVCAWNERHLLSRL